MNKILTLLFCSMCFLGVPSNFCSAENAESVESDHLLVLFNYAAESGDKNLIKEVVQSILAHENSNEILLDALTRYSEKGNINFALHNAIKDKNLLASIILAYYAKEVNTTKDKEYFTYAGTRDSKTPAELALKADLIALIPYLQMKGADLYRMRAVTYVLEEEEENVDYFAAFSGCYPVKKIAHTTKQVYYETPGHTRSLIGDAIIKNRIEVIKMLDKSKVDWNRICFSSWDIKYKPLNLCLAIKRYEIAQYLIDHGAKIE